MLDLATHAPEPRRIAGATGDWEMVIGLEVHAQIDSLAKLFSGASTEFGAEPNANVSFGDAAMPGTLPVLNRGCIAQAVRTGLGLQAQIHLTSSFDRKHYFYPDLPSGFQLTQFFSPLITGGEILVEMGPGLVRRVRLDRIHVEQDAGKLVHDMDPAMSFVDVNRGGMPLMEIVSLPDMRSPEEAAAYLAKLRQIMRYLGTCDGNMQEGSIRADVNVSVCRPGQYEKWRESGDFSHLGTRTEIKNVNSLRFIQQAAEYEARRQIAVIEDGGTLIQETRLYDADKGETRSMRSKETAEDYRYFPDPDLLPLVIEQAWVDELGAALPELPDARKARYMADFGLSDYDASVLTAEHENADYFEAVARDRDGKQAANWVLNELFGRMKRDEGVDITNCPMNPAQLGAIIDLIGAGTISGKIAKDLFEIVYTEGGDPAAIVEARGMKQVTDTGAIEAAVDAVIAENPAQVEKAKLNPKLAGWFVGQVMKATGGKASPAAVNEIVAAKLGL